MSSARQTDGHGWIPQFDHKCTPISQLFVAIAGVKLIALAELPITFTSPLDWLGLSVNPNCSRRSKKTSSAWIKTQGSEYGSFFWQGGYGDFSIWLYSQLDDLIRYIDNQDTHHKTKTFQEEYREMLQKYNVPFDERYVWD